MAYDYLVKDFGEFVSSIEGLISSLTVSLVGNASALAKVDTGEHLMKLLYS